MKTRSGRRSKGADGENVLELPMTISVPNSPPGTLSRKPVERDERFFSKKRTEASQTKSKIVVDTFMGWSSVMLTTNPVALWYVDLYCGPGVYADGTPSTPLELFDKVATHPQLSQILHMVFNDRKNKSVMQLRENLMRQTYWDRMRHKPTFSRGEVDEQMVAELRKRKPRPFTFAFIDPFGYKGLTRDLIDTILGDFGCDVLFFFAYQWIKRVLNNPNDKMRAHVEALFGAQRLREIRDFFNSTDDEQAVERMVLSALADSMREINGQDILPFAFRRRTGGASHHLVFVSKHERGFQVAKEAMGRASSWSFDDGIPSLEYMAPGYDNKLFVENAPSLEKLVRLLVRRGAGKEVNVDEAYDLVTFDIPYVKSNVRAALVKLVAEYGATLTSEGQPAKLRGSRLPHDARIAIPRTLRR